MFDSLPQIEPVRKPPGSWRGAALILAATVTLITCNAAAPRPSAIILSTNHLRQIEVFAAPDAATRYYLCNAGFRSRRLPRLILTILPTNKLANPA